MSIVDRKKNLSRTYLTVNLIVFILKLPIVLQLILFYKKQNTNLSTSQRATSSPPVYESRSCWLSPTKNKQTIPMCVYNQFNKQTVHLRVGIVLSAYVYVCWLVLVAQLVLNKM